MKLRRRGTVCPSPRRPFHLSAEDSGTASQSSTCPSFDRRTVRLSNRRATRLRDFSTNRHEYAGSIAQPYDDRFRHLTALRHFFSVISISANRSIPKRPLLYEQVRHIRALVWRCLDLERSLPLVIAAAHKNGGDAMKDVVLWNLWYGVLAALPLLMARLLIKNAMARVTARRRPSSMKR